MHDIKAIRSNPAEFDAGLARRGMPAQSDAILKLDEDKRGRQTHLQELLSKRNQFAKSIGMAKAKGEDTSGLMEESRTVNERIAMLENELTTGDPLTALLSSLPNIPAADVPDGKDEHDNKELRAWGQKPALTFKPKLHDELGAALGMMDFEAAAKISGARFVVLKGALARLERALAGFFLDRNVAAGYTEIVPPFLVRNNAVYGTGQLPKFAEDLFHTDNDFWLIPTAEVPLTNLVGDSILDEEKLPLRYTAYTPCFRSEAGAAGKDTRGMIRQHQFSKVELVSIVHPDKSQEEHERMTAQAESLLQTLGLPYRTMLLCTGDMGFSSQKTYDIEVWMPGQNAYREISSCSNCGDFQARRMKARFRLRQGSGVTSTGDPSRRSPGGVGGFVHTLNGSGLPIGRTMVAVMENYQQADGSIIVPEVLRSYMDGMEKIGIRD